MCFTIFGANKIVYTRKKASESESQCELFATSQIYVGFFEMIVSYLCYRMKTNEVKCYYIFFSFFLIEIVVNIYFYLFIYFINIFSSKFRFHFKINVKIFFFPRYVFLKKLTSSFFRFKLLTLNKVKLFDQIFYLNMFNFLFIFCYVTC